MAGAQKLAHQIFRPKDARSSGFRRGSATATGILSLPPSKAWVHKSLKTNYSKLAVRAVSLVDQYYCPQRSTVVDVERLVDFLYEDLPRVFGDQGIDRTAYDENVKFSDPITKHDSLSGYLFNIAFLKTLFRPQLQLHWVKQTGPHEITARWTVIMEYVLLPWKPELVLTGTSVMGINPKTGKFCTHVDLWDSIRQNNYFSLEAYSDIFKQMWINWIYRTPDFGSPKYQILKRMPNYEVRKYAPLVATEGHEYSFGNNSAKENTLTTSIILPDQKNQEKDNLRIRVKGGTAAVLKFIGKSTEDVVREKDKIMRSCLIADGLRPKTGCFVSRYTRDPERTWSFFSRNEVLIWLEDFTLD